MFIDRTGCTTYLLFMRMLARFMTLVLLIVFASGGGTMAGAGMGGPMPHHPPAAAGTDLSAGAAMAAMDECAEYDAAQQGGYGPACDFHCGLQAATMPGGHLLPAPPSALPSLAPPVPMAMHAPQPEPYPPRSPS